MTWWCDCFCDELRYLRDRCISLTIAVVLTFVVLLVFSVFFNLKIKTKDEIDAAFEERIMKTIPTMSPNEIRRLTKPFKPFPTLSPYEIRRYFASPALFKQRLEQKIEMENRIESNEIEAKNGLN